MKHKMCDMLKTTYRMCLARKCELYDITCQHVLNIEGYIKFETNHLNHNINKYNRNISKYGGDKLSILGH